MNRKSTAKKVAATYVQNRTASNLITVFVERINLPSKQMMGYAVGDDPQWFRGIKDVESHVIGTIKDHVDDHSKVKSVRIWNHQNFRSFDLSVEVRDSDWERATYLVEDLVEKAIVKLAREFDQRFVADMKIGEISFSQSDYPWN